MIIDIKKFNVFAFTETAKSILGGNTKYIFLTFYFLFLIYISRYFIINSYLNFDEFQHLQEPKNFVTFNLFATYYDGTFRVLDPLISVGPTLLLPIGVLFKIFGVNFFIARIYMGLIFLFYVLLFLYISNKLWGQRTMFLLSLILLCIPHFFDYSLHVLGEIPAMLFFLIGILFFNKFQSNDLIRYLIISAICFALAIITKNIYVLLFPAIGFLAIYRYSKKKNYLNILILLIMTIITLFINMLIDVYYSGINTYKSNLSILITSYGQLGGAIGDNLLLSKIYLLTPKISILEAESGLNRYVILIIILIILFGFLIYLQRHNLRLTEFFFFSFAMIYVAWWFLISTLPWYRHLFPAILLSTPLVAISFNEYVIKLMGYLRHRPILWSRSTVIILCLSLMVAIYTILLYSSISSIPYSCEYTSEKECVNYINTNINHSLKIGYWGFWQAPSISFFVNNTFINILSSRGQEQLRSDKDYVIVTSLQTQSDPQSWKYEKIYCGDIIFHDKDYDIYKYDYLNYSNKLFGTYLETLNQSNFSSEIDFSNKNYDDDQIIQGFYYDPVSWRAVGKTASFCLKNINETSNLTIYGFIPEGFFKKSILINATLNGIYKKSVILDNKGGNFQIAIALPKNISNGKITCATIEANQTYTPQNGDPRDISLILTKMIIN